METKQLRSNLILGIKDFVTMIVLCKEREINLSISSHRDSAFPAQEGHKQEFAKEGEKA